MGRVTLSSAVSKGWEVKTPTLLFANYPALTFFLKKIQFPEYWFMTPVKVLNKYANLRAAMN